MVDRRSSLKMESIFTRESSLLAGRAELRRTRLQRVREAGMQGRLWLPATSTHYDHGAQPRLKVFDFFPREENRSLENPCGTAENQRQHNSHMALAGNRTGVTLVRGERFMHKPTMPLAPGGS